MFKKRVTLLLILPIAIFCSNIVMLPPLSAQTAYSPKIHLLFVWGSKAEDTRLPTLISKVKIENAFNDFNSIGLRKGSEHVGTYQTLQGEDAHPQKILDACRAIAAKAGQNDAVFVYILCHGAATFEDNDTVKTKETKIHVLSPVCRRAEELELREIGIRRSSIMKAMQSQKHRLDVLITDACSTRAPYEDPKFIPVFNKSVILEDEHVSLLARFLLTARGELNINSTDPNRGINNQGELALAWFPISSLNLQDAKYYQSLSLLEPKQGSALKKLVEDTAKLEAFGTVFTRAFIAYASQPATKPSYSTEDLFAGLKKQLNTTYTNTKETLLQNGEDVELFMSQSQTLTRFNGGVVRNP